MQSLNLHPSLLQATKELGYEKPTPIQAEAIPLIRSGRDLLACAATGSGKTAAFLLPTIEKLLAGPPTRRTRVLVLAPTRELAAQVAADCHDLAGRTKVRAAAIYGGVGMHPQIRAFKAGVDVLVATPGRLLDHLQYPYANLDHIGTLILDEADRMLDMGFLPDIRRILARVPKRRQTLFFSATMPPEIAKLAQEILQDPASIATERKSAPAAGVRQLVIPVPQADKPRLLLDVLGRDGVRSVLCFTRTKRRADRLAMFLVKHGVAAERIHGNRSQGQRERALDAFRRGRLRVLVATDIAARGIDIDDLSHVINFDVPNVAEDYIHRVGRTARASRTGDALTFVARDEESDLAAIEKALQHRIEKAPRFAEEQEPVAGETRSGGKKRSPAARSTPPKSGGRRRQAPRSSRTRAPRRVS